MSSLPVLTGQKEFVTRPWILFIDLHIIIAFPFLPRAEYILLKASQIIERNICLLELYHQSLHGACVQLRHRWHFCHIHTVLMSRTILTQLMHYSPILHTSRSFSICQGVSVQCCIGAASLDQLLNVQGFWNQLLIICFATWIQQF